MDVRPAIIINRWDLSPPLTGEVEEWARQEGIALLGRIPFDEAVHRCMAAGAVVVNEPSPAGQAIREVWERAADLL
jgi:MinD superfamily P-loop ATPase